MQDPSPNTDRRQARVPAQSAGARLDRFLTEHFPNYSRRRLMRAIKAGLVRVNGALGKPGTLLAAGDLLDLPVWSRALPELEQARAATRDSTRPDDAIVELHRDEDLLIVSKPPGISVHGGAGHIDPTLIDLLREDILAGFGLVHRIDRGTSGAIALVRGDELRRVTAARFADPEGGVRKVYEAIVSGVPESTEGEIDLPLAPPGHRGRARVDPEGGRPSRTLYRVLESFVRSARLELELVTGRTHQIRVHLAAIGHPLLVDALYTGRKGWRIPDPRGKRDAHLRRPPLHARELTLPHPRTGVPVVAVAPVPADMKYVMEVLRVIAGRGRKRGGLPPA